LEDFFGIKKFIRDFFGEFLGWKDFLRLMGSF